MFYVLLKDELPVYEKVWNKADAFCPLNNRALSKRFFSHLSIHLQIYNTHTYFTSIGNCSVDWHAHLLHVDW